MSLKNFFRQEVLDLKAYHLDEHKGVKLNQNEAPWDIPVPLKTAVVENLLKAPWNRYPLSDPVILKKKMAKHLNVWPDNLVFANGSNVLVQALVLATALKNKIMTLDPSFGVYELEGKLLGNEIIRIPLREDFSIPEDVILEKIKKEKPGIILIPNPNAPTGNLFSPDIIKRIIEAASCLVVIDEAYYPFSKTTVIEWIKKYENLVVMRTFSKAYALGGLRLGWLIADSEVAFQIQKCLLPFCVNKLTYVTAITVLDNMDYVDRYVKDICAERNRVYEEMKKLRQIKTYPSQTNFILFESDKQEELFNKLLEEKVTVRNVSDGRRLSKALRVTIGTKEENEIFLKALKKVAN